MDILLASGSLLLPGILLATLVTCLRAGLWREESNVLSLLDPCESI